MEDSRMRQNQAEPCPPVLRRRNAGPLAGSLALLVVLTLPWSGCADASREDDLEEPITIFAAASTTEVLTEVLDALTTGSAVTCRTSFLASSTLARQIDQGAGADIFFSANAEWMDWLAERGRIQPDSRRDLLRNELVLIAPRDRVFEVRIAPEATFADDFTGRLALADPDHVPAGIYACQALEALGWWSRLEPRIVRAADVRDALRFVETAQADAGIVYRTDAVASDRVAVVAAIPAELHDPIRYPVALTVRADPRAGELLDRLASPATAAIFARYGFTPLQSAASAP